MYWEESDSQKANASFVDKVVNFFAPERAKKQVEEKAKSRQEKEEGAAKEKNQNRTYEEYLAEKKKERGTPMAKDVWEARYK